jgi:hypothetical protein
VAATSETDCLGCGTRVIVFPSNLAGLLPGKLEHDFRAHLHETESEDGTRFAVADEARVWTCPVCGREGVVPVVDFN